MKTLRSLALAFLLVPSLLPGQEAASPGAGDAWTPSTYRGLALR